MVAEAIRRGEETAEVDCCRRPACSSGARPFQNELDSVSDQIEAAKQQAAEANDAFFACMTGITTVVVPLRSALMSASGNREGWSSVDLLPVIDDPSALLSTRTT